MSFTLHRLKRRTAGAIAYAADWALFVGVVLIGGLGSSWYMVEAGTRLTTVNVGPWTMWTAAARLDADPYTRAHFARLGALPMPSEFAFTYIARTDGDGRRLHSSCDYRIKGLRTATHWWSLAVFDEKGALIPNPAERYTFTSDTTALKPDGAYEVALSRDAATGNWLPTGGAGRLAVVFTAIDLGLQTGAREDFAQDVVPTMERAECR